MKTVDNFGLQGEAPSHPELLDWLAADFRDSGWDLHHLIRRIVLSATYRQDSRHRPELEDPDNRLLARGPSFRLPAETIRDQALAVSGLLTRAGRRPERQTLSAAGIWEDLNAPESHAEVYQQDSGPALYRKSLYTYWRRAAMHPAMAVFDAPSRDVCSVRRSTTNTPLQALAILHDPTYIEAARKLAGAGAPTGTETRQHRHRPARSHARPPSDDDGSDLLRARRERVWHTTRSNPDGGRQTARGRRIASRSGARPRAARRDGRRLPRDPQPQRNHHPEVTS